jgi:uncharacterized protein
MNIALGIAQGIGFFLFFAVMLLAIVSLIVGLPGTWIIVMEAIIFALVTKFNHGIGWWDLLLLLALAGAGEAFELVVTAYGAKKFGASNRAVLAALVGGLAGAFLANNAVPIIGALVGAFLGVYLGAFLYTWWAENDSGQAFRAGIGAFMGRMGAILIKGAIAVAMTAVIVHEVFWG